ncbi:hypothetical protein ACSTJG_24050, partial [Vibrio parahaemolyticus]
AVAVAETTAELKELRIRYLGSNGLISREMRGIGGLPADQRKPFGQRVNEAKATVEGAIEARESTLRQAELAIRFEAERVDVTMPGATQRFGYEHVLQATTNKIKRVLGGIGFEYRESPELEEFRYNFDALNYPP